jgi:alkylated DNA repair dioxygenase AlkB
MINGKGARDGEGGVMSLAWQESLFGDLASPDPAAAAGALAVGDVRRLDLDERCWLELAPGWLPGHGELFDQLHAEAPWQQRERRMYDRDVLEPRLVAAWFDDALAALPDRLQEIRAAVSDHYRVDFDSVLVNLYRDGRDGVAWHGDTVRKRLPEALVVTVGLGERRRFLLRPGDRGPATVELETGQGDLVVMGGRTQHEWQHTVPKAARAGARMSVTLRHSRPLRG